MMTRKAFANRPVLLLWLAYSVAAVGTAAQCLALGRDNTGWTHYENYLIFKYSWLHLVAGINPYAPAPEVWDLFKYSPAFAVGMAPLSALPDWLGLPLWDLLNALPLLAGLLALPGLTPNQKQWMAWLVLPELVVALRNSQSNGLTAALMIWTLIALSRQQPARAALWAVAGGFLKIFGGLAVLLVLFFPQQIRRFGGSVALWGVVLAALPVLVIGPTQLVQVYRWWWELLANDHAASVGLSVSGWLSTWWGWEPPKLAVTLAGFGMLVTTLLVAAWRRQSALPALALLLIWVVIFNHKAESPTFVIALCGAALWWALQPRPLAWWVWLLFGAAFVLASLSPTDLFPRTWREQVVQPYVLKAVPFIAIWGVLTWQLLVSKGQPETAIQA